MRRRMIAVVAGAGLLAAGCGVSAEDSFKTARKNLAKSKTATMSFYVSLPGGGDESGDGRLRFGSQTDMSIDYTSFSAPAPQQTTPTFGAATPVRPTIMLTNAIAIGSNVYARGVGVAPAGKTWAGTDRSRTVTGTGVDLLDPMTYLKMAATTKYPPSKGGGVSQANNRHPGERFTLDCPFNESGCSVDDLGALGTAFPDSRAITFDVWLDGKGRPTHLSVSADLYKNVGPGIGGTLRAEMSLSGFGKPVTIAAPPSAQVAYR